MRLHRFYIGGDIKLQKDFWIHDEKLLWQWNKVLRFRPDQEVILFDGKQTERLYKVSELSKKEAHLQLITEMKPKIPNRHIYLFWSLLKRENNEYIIQKCTEIGVSNFVPILSERTIKKEFNYERGKKIIIEASEQCGRGNIPDLREPLHLQKAIEDYKDKIRLLFCHKGNSKLPKFEADEKIGIIIGPEGGWSEDEQKMFAQHQLNSVDLGDFTLRAETAAIVASSKLL